MPSGIPLNIGNLAKSAECGTHGGRSRGRNSVSTTSHGLLARLAGPDTDGRTPHAVLSAECAGISSVLGHFLLLNELTERSTVSCAVLAGDADLLSALRHFGCEGSRMLVSKWSVILAEVEGSSECSSAKGNFRSVRKEHPPPTSQLCEARA
jgi:hypothetical protein